MDPVTIALAGAVAALAVRGECVSARTAVVIGVLAALLPDLDILYAAVNPGLYHFNRGAVTHSLWALLAWAWVAGWIGVRWAARSESITMRAAVTCAGAALASHIILDALSLQGVIPFAPVSSGEVRWSLFTHLDLLVTLALVLPFVVFAAVPRLRRHTLEFRARITAVAVAFAIVTHVGLFLVAKSQVVELADTHGVSTDEVHVWPNTWMSLRKSAAVVDAGLVYHLDLNLVAAPAERFTAVIPVNDTVEGFAEVTGLDTMTPALRRWDVPVATVWASDDRRFDHLFIGDLRFQQPGAAAADHAGDQAPRAYAVVKRGWKDADIVFAQWRWRDPTLRPTPKRATSNKAALRKPAPKKPAPAAVNPSPSSKPTR